MTGPAMLRIAANVFKGTISPLLLRTLSWPTLAASLRNEPSAWRLTCQERPKTLKLLTYSEPM